jgi:hypothetical protein
MIRFSIDDFSTLPNNVLRIQFERLLLAVTSSDRRNTIILTELDGVFADEKKVPASRF